MTVDMTNSQWWLVKREAAPGIFSELWHKDACFYNLCICLQKAVRDREFEALQGKVQRLEKLRRALKVERNELNKKVQNLSGQPSGTTGAPTTDTGTESPSPPPTDNLLEPSSCPEPDTTPCSRSCHCDPQELDTDNLIEEAQAVAAQEWSNAARTPPPLYPPASSHQKISHQPASH